MCYIVLEIVCRFFSLNCSNHLQIIYACLWLLYDREGSALLTFMGSVTLRLHFPYGYSDHQASLDYFLENRYWLQYIYATNMFPFQKMSLVFPQEALFIVSLRTGRGLTYFPSWAYRPWMISISNFKCMAINPKAHS